MSEATFTPGKWTVAPASSENNGLVHPEHTEDSTTPWWTLHVVCQDTETQNAVYRMAAAAPDLYACLKVVMEHIDDSYLAHPHPWPLASIKWHWFNHARATLSKARGEQP